VRRFPGALIALALACVAIAQGEGERWYVVREGDTLTRIAVRHGVTVADIAGLNGIDPRGVIRIGQRLRLPPEPAARGAAPPASSPLPAEVSRPVASLPSPPPLPEAPVTHLVEQGDTLYALSKRYGVPLPDLMAWNGMGPKDVLRVGQRLTVRRAQATPPQPPVATAPQPAPPGEEDQAGAKSAAGKDAPEESRREPVEPKPDAAPQKAPEPEAEPEVAAGTKPRTTPVSTKHSGSGLRLPFLSRTKTDAAGVHLRECKEQIDKPKVKRDRWKYIVIHHSGTGKGSAEVFDHYHRMVRGMENGMAYHFVIGNGSYTGDGQIEVGDRWLKQKAGGHLYSEFLNGISIGICFVGNFNVEKPTARQVAACIELVDYLRKICPGSRPKFVLHREINPRPTECPGKLFPGDALRKRLK